MIIRNKQNESLAINTELVCNYYKQDLNERINTKPYCVNFSYSAANYDEQYYECWMFETKEERDEAWDKIMEIVSAQWI